MTDAPAAQLRAWPADEVVRRPLAALVPYPRNARLHSDEQVRQIADSMLRWGVTVPVLVDEAGVLIFGHGRLRAAQLLVSEGHAQFAELPVSVARGWSEEEKNGYRLADNQLALLGEWDRPTLKAEAAALQLAGFDMPLLGFGAQLGGILSNPADKDPDAPIDAVPAEPITRPGDVWQLGGHRLVCGDATVDAAWDGLFGLERAAVVFTDPPYGVSYESRGSGETVIGDEKRRDELYKMLLGALRNLVRKAAPDAGFYIWHASTTRQDFVEAMRAAGLIERQYLIWVKPSIALGHSDYRWQHEPCFYASRAEQAPAFYGDRAGSTVWYVGLGYERDRSVAVGAGLVLLDGTGQTLYVQSRAPKHKKLRQVRLAAGGTTVLSTSDRPEGTVWEVRRDPGGYVHPTQKPVELARRAIENSSRPGEVVADAFLGSGSTLIAAELTGRRCYAFELEPGYCDVAVRRWQELSGQRAVRRSKDGDVVEGDGDLDGAAHGFEEGAH